MFACEKSDLEPFDDTNAISEADAFAKGIGNAPEQSGPYLIRIDDIGAYFLVDSKTGLSLGFGADKIAFCNGDPDPFEVEPIQFIDIPSNELRLIFLQQGEVYAEVFNGIWDGSIPFCNFLLNTPVLAEGMVQFIYTDNDYLGLSNSNNTNTWGARVHGRLLNEDNKTKNLSASFHGVWDKNELFYFTQSVRLQQ